MAALDAPSTSSASPTTLIGSSSDIKEHTPAIIEVEDAEAISYSQIQTISSSSDAPVYDFNAIEKCFPDDQNVMVTQGQRVIPIYICKPLQIVQQVMMKKSPLELEQESILRELQKIDQMIIEIIKIPIRGKTDNSRKTKLITLPFAVEPKETLKTVEKIPPLQGPNNKTSDEGEKVVAAVACGEEEEKNKKLKRKWSDKQDESPKKEFKMELRSSQEMKREIPVDEVTRPSLSQPAATCIESSPVRSESPEKEPQFACDKCEKRFFLKRAMLRHLYSHK